MDQRLQYEQLIAGKLQSLPVPDMADAIWARVEAQLDIDLPTDDGGGDSPSPQSPSGSGLIGWGLSVVVIALITIFLVYKNKPKSAETQDQPITNKQLNQPSQNSTGPPGRDDGSSIKNPGSFQAGVPNVSLGSQQDSVVQQPVTAAVTPSSVDSMLSTGKSEPLVVVPSPTLKDTTPVKKKGKGVGGLSDNDYRIIPKNKQ